MNPVCSRKADPAGYEGVPPGGEVSTPEDNGIAGAGGGNADGILRTRHDRERWVERKCGDGVRKSRERKSREREVPGWLGGDGRQYRDSWHAARIDAQDVNREGGEPFRPNYGQAHLIQVTRQPGGEGLYVIRPTGPLGADEEKAGLGGLLLVQLAGREGRGCAGQQQAEDQEQRTEERKGGPPRRPDARSQRGEQRHGGDDAALGRQERTHMQLTSSRLSAPQRCQPPSWQPASSEHGAGDPARASSALQVAHDDRHVYRHLLTWGARQGC